MKNLKITTDLNYDYDLSSIYFNENFEVLQHSSYNTSSLLLYTCDNQLSTEYCNIDNIEIVDNKYNRIMLIKAILEDGYYSYSDLKDDDIEALKVQFIDDAYSRDFEDLKSICDDLDERKISYDLNYYDFESRGYSQGDYSKILVNIKEWEKLTGACFLENINSLQKTFDNLLWDSPLSGSVNISFDYYKNAISYNYDEEFEIYEINNDNYEIDLDLDLIINSIKKELIHDLKEDDYNKIKNELSFINYTDIQS